MDEQLNPNFVNLAKAIGQTESGGNYNATGDGGASQGAYQMSPAFASKYAQGAGVNYAQGQPLSMQDQNKVAYNAVKTMAGQGLSAAQIAWAWNAGEGSLSDFGDEDYGKNNNYGSTMNYVRQVEKNYGALGGGAANAQPTSASATPSQQQPDFISQALGMGAGVLGWLGSQGGNILKAGVPIAGGLAVGALTDSPIAGVAADVGIKGLEDQIFGGGSGGSSQPPQTPQIGDSGATGGGSGDTSGLADLFNTPQGKQSALVSSLINEQMQGTQTNRNFASSDPGKEAIGSMGAYGYAPEVDQNGNMSFRSASESANENESKAANIEVMAAGGSQVPMMSVLNEAGRYLGENKLMTPDQRKEASDLVGQYARAYAPSNASVPGDKAIEARHQQYKATKGAYGTISTSQKEARKALAFGFREAALKASKNPELQRAAIKEQQKHINAKQVMKRLEGKRAIRQPSVWKSAVLRTAARYAEIYIGDKIGGPIGAVLGLVAGEHLNRAVDKALAKTKWDTPQMKAAMDILRRDKPQAYDKITDALKKGGISFAPEKKTGGDVPATEKDIEMLRRKWRGEQIPNEPPRQVGILRATSKKGLVSRAARSRKQPTLQSRAGLQSRQRPAKSKR